MRQLIERCPTQKAASAAITLWLEFRRSTIYRNLRRGNVTHLHSQRDEYTTYSANFTAYKGSALKINSSHDLIKRLKVLVLYHKYALDTAHMHIINKGMDTKVALGALYSYIRPHRFTLLPNQLIPGPRKPGRQRIRKRLAHNNLKGRSIEERPPINNSPEIVHHEMDTAVTPPAA